MDKYGAINVQASLNEKDDIILNTTGMEKQSDAISDSNICIKDCKDKCIEQHDPTITDKTTKR